jgi:hypothetical protein
VSTMVAAGRAEKTILETLAQWDMASGDSCRHCCHQVDESSSCVCLASCLDLRHQM